MVSETWPPCRTRESRSRPSWSVPNRCPSVSGGSRRADEVLVVGVRQRQHLGQQRRG